MSESKFGKRLRQQLEHLGIHSYRIESHGTSPGCPDIHFVHRNTSGWLELKESEIFPTRIEYRPKQALWLRQYEKNGGRCWTICHVRFTDTMLIIPGRDSLAAEKGLNRSGYVQLECGGREPWEDLFSLLTD